MFNKDSLSKIKDYLFLIGMGVIFGYILYFTVTLTYSEILASNSIFESICQFPLVFLALIFLCLEALILYALTFLIYNTIKDLFRKYKTATILIALLIWFTCAQGIFNVLFLALEIIKPWRRYFIRKHAKPKNTELGQFVQMVGKVLQLDVALVLGMVELKNGLTKLKLIILSHLKNVKTKQNK